jgi:hypothetical protein
MPGRDRFGGLLIDAPATETPRDRFGGLLVDAPPSFNAGSAALSDVVQIAPPAMELAGLSGPAPADPLDFSQMYADINRRDIEANVQGINTYDFNQKLAADAEQDRLNSLPGAAVFNSMPSRIAQSTVGQVADAFVNPILSVADVAANAAKDAIGGLPGVEPSTERYEGFADELSKRQANADMRAMRDKSWIEKTGEGIVGGVAKAVALARTGGLSAITASFLNTTYEDTKRNAMKSGATEEEAGKMARSSAAWEVVPMLALQYFGLGGAESAILNGTAGKGVKRFVMDLLAELPEEAATQFGQSLSTNANVGTWKDYLDVVAQTAGTVGLIHGTPAAVGKIQNFIEKRTPRAAREANITPAMAPNQKARDRIADGIQQQTEQMVAPVATPPAEPPLTPQPTPAITFDEAAQSGWRPVYHGTTAKFDAAEMRPARSAEYAGYHFTNDKAQATRWGSMSDGYEGSTHGEPRTIEAMVNLQNPASSKDVKAAKKVVGEDASPEELTDELKRRGFDGVVNEDYIGNEVVAFDRSQFVTRPTQEQPNQAPSVAPPVPPAVEQSQTDGAGVPGFVPDRDQTPQESGESAAQSLQGGAVSPDRDQSRLTTDAFRAQLAEAATSPEEADALYSLYEARAESAGESLDDYVAKRLKGVERVPQGKSRGLRAGKYDSPRGEISFFVDDGRAIIRSFEKVQNVATLAHETGHLFRRDLAGPDLEVAEKWAGVEHGKKWHRKAEEKFARGFEKYLRTGKSPTPKLKPVFERFKGWLTGLYQRLQGSPIDVKIPAEMQGVYDRLFTPPAPPVKEPSPITTNTQPDNDLYAPEPPAAIAPDGGAAEPGAPVQQTLFQAVEGRFRGLANQTAKPDARAANYDVDVEMGFPESKKWADAESAALARLSADPVGELQRFIRLIDEANRSGGTVDLRDMTDAVVLNKLKEFAAEKIGDPDSRALHRKLHEAFRKARTEQARSLGYRDPVTSADPVAKRRKTIADAISEPTPAEQTARDKASKPEEHAEVDKMFEERFRKAKEKLASLGIDIDDLGSIAADPKKSMIVLDHFRPQVAGWSDYLYEYWRNAILSGPRTQLTNIIGNTAFSTWNLGPERAAEAFVNLFARDKKSASFGEFKHLAAGVMPGVLRGLRNAGTAWRLETPALADELGREGAFKVDGPRGAIPGKIGRLVRAFGYRPLLAADEFAKSVIVSMEVGAHAYRAGKAKGLAGSVLEEFISSQVDTLDSYAWSAAFAKAEELTFQGKRGMVASALSSGGNKLRSGKLGRAVGRWVIPFVDTPAAIMEEGIKRMPVLGAILDYAEARRGGANIADAGMTATLARQLIALGGMAMLWAAVDDDDPWITGSAVMSTQGGRDLAHRTHPPQSIKIAGKWVGYDKIEPLPPPCLGPLTAFTDSRAASPLRRSPPAASSRSRTSHTWMALEMRWTQAKPLSMAIGRASKNGRGNSLVRLCQTPTAKPCRRSMARFPNGVCGGLNGSMHNGR